MYFFQHNQQGLIFEIKASYGKINEITCLIICKKYRSKPLEAQYRRGIIKKHTKAKKTSVIKIKGQKSLLFAD